MPKMVQVVCAIVYKEDRIFVCRRKPGKTLAGYWEFPGGKIEKSESPTQSLERELKEELQMEVNHLEYFSSSEYDYENFRIKLIAYRAELDSWSGTLNDHDAYRWVEKSKLTDLALAPADIPIAEKLIEG